MKTIRFKYVGEQIESTLHTCSELGDNSGEYVRKEDVRDLLEAANRLLDARSLSMEFDRALKELDAVLTKFTSSSSLSRSEGIDEVLSPTDPHGASGGKDMATPGQEWPVSRPNVTAKR